LPEHSLCALVQDKSDGRPFYGDQRDGQYVELFGRKHWTTWS